MYTALYLHTNCSLFSVDLKPCLLSSGSSCNLELGDGDSEHQPLCYRPFPRRRLLLARLRLKFNEISTNMLLQALY